MVGNWNSLEFCQKKIPLWWSPNPQAFKPNGNGDFVANNHRFLWQILLLFHPILINSIFNKYSCLMLTIYLLLPCPPLLHHSFSSIFLHENDPACKREIRATENHIVSRANMCAIRLKWIHCKIQINARSDEHYLLLTW